MPTETIDTLQIKNKPKTNVKILNKTSWIYLFLMLVWLFVAILMPANPAIGGINGAHVNSFYESYFINNKVSNGLTPLAIATIVFFCVGILISLLFIFIYLSKKEYVQYTKKGKQYQFNLVSWWIAYSLLFSAVIVLFGLAMSPPYMNQLIATWPQSQAIQNINNQWNNFVASASSTSVASASLQTAVIDLANKLGLNLNQILDVSQLPSVPNFSNAQIANIIYVINNTVLGNPYESQMQSLDYQWNTYLQNAITSGASIPTAIEQLALKLAHELNINVNDLLGLQTTPSSFTTNQMSALINAINKTSFNYPSGHLTVVWNFAQQAIIRAGGWYANVCIFGIVLSLLFILPGLGHFVILMQTQERKQYRETLKTMLAEYRKMNAERKELKKNKKALREQEDELLSNLEQIKIDNKHEDTIIEQLSQQELEEQMAKANALKEEIEHLRRQREQIEQQANKNNKKAAAGHRQPTRQKKQQISVPDEELEEIFKSLDID